VTVAISFIVLPSASSCRISLWRPVKPARSKLTRSVGLKISTSQPQYLKERTLH
jgi:hypothetical protein